MATAACRRLPHVSDEQIGDILAFLGGGARPRCAGRPMRRAGECRPVRWWLHGGAPRPPVPASDIAPPAPQSYPEGVDAPAQRYFTDYGLGYPYLLAPPWSQIMAYDLNRGVIKWRKPLGQDLDVDEGRRQGHRRAARLAAPGHDRHVHRHRVLHRRATACSMPSMRTMAKCCGRTSCPWAPKDCRRSIE